MISPGAEGSSPAGSNRGKKTEIDPRAVLAMRTYLTMSEPQPSGTFKFDNKLYLQADLLRVIQEEDEGGGRAGGGGDSPSPGGGAAAAGRGTPAAGREGRSAAGGPGGTPSGRKTKHSVHRLLSCIMMDKHRLDFIRSGEKARRPQLDAGEVGAAAGAWVSLHATYTDKDVQVGRTKLKCSVFPACLRG